MTISQLKIGDLTATIPIIQGGMGVGISLSGLSSAVANEGGIGVIATVMTGMDEPDIAFNPTEANVRILKQEIRKARQKTNGIIGVNIMVALTNYDEVVQASIHEGIDIIFSGAGLPLSLPKHLHNGTKTKLAPIVSSGRAAALLCKKWTKQYNYPPDAVIVEGPLAGGHLGFKPEQIDNPAFSLEKLTADVLEEVKPYESKYNKKIPVIPAGGIFTGRDIKKYLDMGASGVQMGTRFVATHECDAHMGFKKAYVDAEKEDTIIIKSPVGMPGRAIRNNFIADVEQGNKKPFKCLYHCIKTCDFKKAPYCISLALINAKKGRLKHGYAFAGKNAYRIREIVSVKELIRTLIQEYNLSSDC